jgi:GTP-binding protein YchF
MRVGLIGFHGAGKTTLLRASAGGEVKGSVAAVPVPDPRFDRIVAQVRPKKATPATVILDDSLDSLSGQGVMVTPRFLEGARGVDLLLHVVRAFESELVPYHDSLDPVRDQRRVEEEFVLADLQLVENRLERLAKSMHVRTPGHSDYLERELFERLRPPLESGMPIRQLDLDERATTILRNYQFLTLKPMVVAINGNEADAADPPAGIRQMCDGLVARGIPAFFVCALLEEEVARLDPADQPEFLRSLGLAEPARNQLIRSVYDALGLITFFTAGENETKAWPLRKGSTALKAAAVIHTDIARGFIRAEVTHFEDYASAGSLAAANAAGKTKLEGKDYVVQDGDLIVIRHKT